MFYMISVLVLLEFDDKLHVMIHSDAYEMRAAPKMK